MKPRASLGLIRQRQVIAAHHNTADFFLVSLFPPPTLQLNIIKSKRNRKRNQVIDRYVALN